MVPRRRVTQHCSPTNLPRINPSVCVGEKKLKVEEFLPIFSQVKKEKEQGTFEDFLECLKLYDKEENGKMLAAELAHTLLTLGEKLSDPETEEVLADCMDKEDDDGFIPYERKQTLNYLIISIIDTCHVHTGIPS